MSLAFLGFAMIVVFMALIMAKKLSPFTSLILVPIAFGLLAGYGWDTLKYAMDGIKSVASTFLNDDVCNPVFRGYAHRRYV